MPAMALPVVAADMLLLVEELGIRAGPAQGSGLGCARKGCLGVQSENGRQWWWRWRWRMRCRWDCLPRQVCGFFAWVMCRAEGVGGGEGEASGSKEREEAEGWARAVKVLSYD